MTPDELLEIGNENFAESTLSRYQSLFEEEQEFLLNHAINLGEGYAIMGVGIDEFRQMLVHNNFQFLQEAAAKNDYGVDEILFEVFDVMEQHYPGFTEAVKSASPEAENMLSRAYLDPAEMYARDVATGRFDRFTKIVDDNNTEFLNAYLQGIIAADGMDAFINFSGVEEDSPIQSERGLLNYIETHGSDEAKSITARAIADYLDYDSSREIKQDFAGIGATLPVIEAPAAPVASAPEGSAPESSDVAPAPDAAEAPAFDYGFNEEPAPEADTAPPVANALRPTITPVIPDIETAPETAEVAEPDISEPAIEVQPEEPATTPPVRDPFNAATEPSIADIIMRSMEETRREIEAERAAEADPATPEIGATAVEVPGITIENPDPIVIEPTQLRLSELLDGKGYHNDTDGYTDYDALQDAFKRAGELGISNDRVELIRDRLSSPDFILQTAAAVNALEAFNSAFENGSEAQALSAFFAQLDADDFVQDRAGVKDDFSVVAPDRRQAAVDAILQIERNNAPSAPAM